MWSNGFKALVEHLLNKAVESPIVEDGPVEMFVTLLVLFGDHLPLGKITDHNGSLNQCVRDEMRGFVQTVLLLVALLLRNALVNLAQVLVAP